MINQQQTEVQESEIVDPHANISDDVFTLIGIFLAFVLIFFFIKGRLRGWTMK